MKKSNHKITDNSKKTGAGMYFLIAGIAIFARLIYIIQIRKFGYLRIPILDAEYYLKWARDIANSNFIGGKIFFTEPLYAYILAVFSKITEHGMFWMIGLQMILGVLSALIIARLGEKLFNRAIGMIAGVIAAFCGLFVFYENLILKTSFEVFFISLFALIAINVLDSEKRKNYLYLGLFLGLSALLRGNSLIFLPLVIFFIWRRSIWEKRKRIIFSLYLIAGFLIAVFPATLHNYLSGKDLVLVNYSLGMNFYQGNFYGSDGSLLQPPFVRPHPKYEETDTYQMAASYLNMQNPKPSKVSSFWFSKTLGEISQHPTSWIGLMGKKIIILISRYEISDNYDYPFYRNQLPILKFMLTFWPIVILGISGAVILALFRSIRHSFEKKGPSSGGLLSSEKKINFVLGLLGIYSLSVILFHVNSRYRVPVIPFLIIFGSFFLWYLYQKLRERDFYSLLPLGFLAAIILFLTSIHLNNFDFASSANFYNNVGEYWNEQKDFSQARLFLEKALAADRNNLWTKRDLFYLEMRDGNFPKANSLLQDEIRLRPDETGVYADIAFYENYKEQDLGEINRKLDEQSAGESNADSNRYDNYFYAGMDYFNEKKYDEAEIEFRKSVSRFGYTDNTVLNLALARKNLKDTAEAEELLKKIIEKNQYFLPAKYNLAQIYLAEKKYSSAASVFREIYELAPEMSDTWYFYALSLAEAKELEAQKIINAFISKYQYDYQRTKQVQNLRTFLPESKP